MSKATVICQSCNTDNDPSSEFCVDCGSNLINNKELAKGSRDKDPLVQHTKELLAWKKSVPYILSAALMVMFIDVVTGDSPFNWSYWVVIPMILFAVIAPYFSLKFSKPNQ